MNLFLSPRNRLRLVVSVAIICLGATAIPESVSAQGQDPSRISRHEIEEHPQVQDALELIKKLRPRFLRGRGRTSALAPRPEPLVYIDNTRALGIDDLSTVPTSNVEDIRYLSPTEAAGRFGSSRDGSAANGVILVRTRRQVRPE